MRNSFVFYESFLSAIDELDDGMKLKVYEAISHYALRSELIELQGIPKVVFSLIKPQLDANIKKFENGKKGAKSGKLGGRPKKEKTPKKPQENPLGDIEENPLGDKIQNPKETPNVNVNVNDNVNENIYPPIIPQRDEKENKIFKLDITSPKIQNEEKEKSCAKKEKIVFDVFWDLYDKKVGDKERLKKKWDNLSLNIQNQILDYIPKYIESQPDKKYRKNPETFFNQKSWEDEIINQNQNQVYKTNQMVYAEF